MSGFISKASNIFWVVPERNTQAQRDFEERRVWSGYRKIIRDMGLRFDLIKPDDINFKIDGSASTCFVRSEKVTPHDTVFVTALWTMPHQVVDAANQIFLYSILESYGFYLPIPPSFAAIAEDKIATYFCLKGCPVKPLPTTRIASGRDTYSKNYAAAAADFVYPVLVRPAYWSMGIGVSVARDAEELHGLVGLARGAETPLIVQPFLEGASDYRVYVVEGRPILMVKRSPGVKSLTANLAAGGSAEWSRIIPPELLSAIQFIAERVPIPFLTMDFLHDGQQFWLSEIEPDGALIFDEDDEVLRSWQVDAARQRFQSFVDGHNRHCERIG